MSDTTAMIDVTATMFPSTVMNDRSLAVQIASSAMRADSQNLFIYYFRGAPPPRLTPSRRDARAYPEQNVATQVRPSCPSRPFFPVASFPVATASLRYPL